MSTLSQQTCGPCNRLTPRLTELKILELHKQTPTWALDGPDGPEKLRKEWKFPDYASAFAFVSQVSAIAEAENHHPDVSFGWGHVRLDILTHAINGLSENDFILAAKIDAISPAES